MIAGLQGFVEFVGALESSSYEVPKVPTYMYLGSFASHVAGATTRCG